MNVDTHIAIIHHASLPDGILPKSQSSYGILPSSWKTSCFFQPTSHPTPQLRPTLVWVLQPQDLCSLEFVIFEAGLKCSLIWNLLRPMLPWAQNWFPVCLLCELLEGRDHGLGPLFSSSPWQHARFGAYSLNVCWLASVSTKVTGVNICWTLPVCQALFCVFSSPRILSVLIIPP